MHGIRGGNILLCTSIWWLTASAKRCSHPSSQMPFSYAGKRVLLGSWEKWLLLMKMSDLSILFLQLCPLWHKNAVPKVVRQTVLPNCATGGWEDFLGKWCEQSGRIAEKLFLITELLPLQVHSSYLEVWNSVFGTEEIRTYSDKMIQMSGGPSSDCSLEILADLYPSWWSWGFAVFPLAGEHPQN